MPDFFGKLKSGAEKVAFEAEKMTRLNKAQGEQGQLKRQIEANYTKLGELTYHRFMNQADESPEVAEICQAIVELEKQVAEKGEEIARIQAENYNPQGATAPTPAPAPAYAPPPVSTPAPVATPVEAPATEDQPATRFCSNCGREVAAGVKFCPDCGTKMV